MKKYFKNLIFIIKVSLIAFILSSNLYARDDDGYSIDCPCECEDPVADSFYSPCGIDKDDGSNTNDGCPEGCCFGGDPYTLADIQGDDEVCIQSDSQETFTFEIKTDPSGEGGNVTWKIPQGTPSSGTGASIDTTWGKDAHKKTITIKATLCNGVEKTKDVKVYFNNLDGCDPDPPDSGRVPMNSFTKNINKRQIEGRFPNSGIAYYQGKANFSKVIGYGFPQKGKKHQSGACGEAF